MRWPRRRAQEPEPERHRASAADAERRLQQLEDRQPRVDELEDWARRELAMNSFSARMHRGLGGR